MARVRQTISSRQPPTKKPRRRKERPPQMRNPPTKRKPREDSPPRVLEEEDSWGPEESKRKDGNLLWKLEFDAMPQLPEVGDAFESLTHLREHIKVCHVAWRRSYRHPANGTNTARRFVVSCTVDDCGFFLKCAHSKSADGMVVKQACAHTCRPEDHKRGYEHVTADVLVRYFRDDILQFESSRTNLRDFRAFMVEQYGLDPQKNITHRAMKLVREEKAESSYCYLRAWLDSLSRDFLYDVKQEWARTASGKSRFQRVYVGGGSLADCARCARPVYSVDGAHLSGEQTHGGTLLIFSGYGPSSARRVCILAFAVVPSETCEEMTWFLRNVRDSIPSLAQEEFLLVSDRGSGLVKEIADGVFPNAQWRPCAEHLVRNVRAHYGKHFLPSEMSDAFRRMVKTLDTVEFRSLFDHFLEASLTHEKGCLFTLAAGDSMNPYEKDIKGYLPHPSAFCNIFFKVPCHGVITSNSTEIANGVAKAIGARRAEVMELVEALLAWNMEKKAMVSPVRS
eukprot:scaffold5222_cov293-Pinguiococcus_pyrenoidosus.AAC.9